MSYALAHSLLVSPEETPRQEWIEIELSRAVAADDVMVRLSIASMHSAFVLAELDAMGRKVHPGAGDDGLRVVSPCWRAGFLSPGGPEPERSRGTLELLDRVTLRFPEAERVAFVGSEPAPLYRARAPDPRWAPIQG